MKKILFFVLMTLLLTVAAVSAQTAVEEVAVSAQTAGEELEISWEDIAPMAKEIDPDGAFYLVGETGLKMWIPAIFIEEELTEEDIDDGMVLFLSTADGSAYVAVNHVDLEGGTLEDGYAGLLLDDQYSDVEMGKINGLKVLSYTNVENDMTGLSFIDSDGYMIQFLFYPQSDEGFSAVAAIMGASIQTGESQDK